ncbi:unnamed protein product [Knipowitschia caucasica]
MYIFNMRFLQSIFVKAKKSHRMKYALRCLLLLPLVLCIILFSAPSIRIAIGLLPMDKCSLQSGKMLLLDSSVDATLSVQSRSDVQTCTKWKAPIIWEGMFDARLFDEAHKRKGSSVALTVFAVGKYLDAYLEIFLNSSEKHFMLGLRVTYYVFTDTPEKVPSILLGPNRSLKVIRVDRHSRWQDISMMRMQTISDLIEGEIRHNFTHVFCFDVDQKFSERFGSEALGDSVALLHAYFYRLPKKMYTYDRNPLSKAYMEQGDFYYHAAVFGGTWRNVKAITDACYKSIVEDKENGVEAIWHDESHLNKYFWLNKPSRVLSPEYCWDDNIRYRTDVLVKRLLWAPKDYEHLRINK